MLVNRDFFRKNTYHIFQSIFFIALFLPYIFIFLSSFGHIDSLFLNQNVFNLNAYYNIGEQKVDALGIILVRSFTVATISTVLAFLFVYLLIKHHIKVVLSILIIITIPLLLNIGIRAISWLDILKIAEKIFAFEYSYSNDAALIISMTSNSIVFPIFAIFISIKMIDKSIIHAAFDLGSSSLTAIIKIIIPNIFPALFLGWLGSFAISILSSFEAHFLTSTKISLTHIFNDYFSASKTIESFALGVIIIFFYTLFLFILYFWIKKYFKRYLHE